MTPSELDTLLSKHFPKDAISWENATDEVRDLCREARIFAGVPEELALDFGSLKTPSEWNTQGIDTIVHFYAAMFDEEGFLKRAAELFPFIFCEPTVKTLQEKLNMLLQSWEIAETSHASEAKMIKDHTDRSDTRAAGRRDMLQACINELQLILKSDAEGTKSFLEEDHDNA